MKKKTAWLGDAAGGNYTAKINAALGGIKPVPGAITYVDVFHDTGCGFHRGRPCNCEPEIRVVTDTDN